MTRLMSERIYTKSDFTGEVRPGDEKCSNQTPRGSLQKLDHQWNRATMSVRIGFRLNLSREAKKIVSVRTKGRPHDGPNGKSRFSTR